MARGSVYKRCPCGQSGTPGKPACRKTHGRWWWRADAPGHSGSRKQPGRGGYESRGAAEAGLTEYLQAKDSGTWCDDERKTVAEWLNKWLQECEEHLEPKTVEGYMSAVTAHLIPHLGSHRMRDLKKHHIEAMLREIAQEESWCPPHRLKVLEFIASHPEGVRAKDVIGAHGRSAGTHLTSLVRDGAVRRVSRGVYVATGATIEIRPGKRAPRTVHGIRRVLRSALGVAVDRRIVPTNEAAGRMSVLPKVGRSEAKCWEPEKVSEFLDACTGRLNAMWWVAVFTGLRRAELCGIRWADVDLDGKAPGVHVRQRLVEVQKQHTCTVCGLVHAGRLIRPLAKTAAGVRWVPLLKETVTRLKEHRAAQEAERDLFGEAYSDHDLVFCLEDGTPLRPSDDVTDVFKGIVAGTGLPSIRLHELRHTATSLLLASGMPLPSVQLLIGHSGSGGGVTMEVYAHTMKGATSKGVEAAATLVRPETRAHSVHSPEDQESSEGRAVA